MPDPLLLVADRHQKIFDRPGYLACGQAGTAISALSVRDLIPLPKGSSLFFLPERSPVGFNVQQNAFESIAGYTPVAAFMLPGYTQLFTTAYAENAGASMLPLYAYTPVAFYRGGLYVPAVRVDRRANHDITGLDRRRLEERVRRYAQSSNRLIRHLAGCACVNSCPNAINFFFGKYEAPLPVSPSCNARCWGCISLQDKGSCAATQPRLDFVPTPGEIAEIALTHIQGVKDAVVSFGQGCEGEPLMAAGVIKEAIMLIRRQTSSGTIHMNTNAGRTADIEDLCRTGLDSIRVSLNSARREYYERYYSPRGYGFDDVVRSIQAAKRQKKFISLNYLVMPGFTDREDEFAAFSRLVGRTKVNMIQWRNLNYDPRLYFRKLKVESDSPLIGIRSVIEGTRRLLPTLRHGYFNVPKGKM